MSGGNDLSTAGRQVLWNVNSWPNQVAMYALFALSLLICGWGVWRRLELWLAGKPDRARLSNFGRRLKRFIADVPFQRKVHRDPNARVFHNLIFYGFLVLLFTTTMVFIDNDLGIKIYHGRFYLGVTVLSDVFGLGLILGCGYAAYHRYVIRPDRLHTTGADGLALVALALMGIQGFALEGLRIHATDDPWALYSPVGFAFSELFWALSIPAARALHFGVWWFHAITVFLFIALIPYTKFAHLLTSTANLFFQDIQRPKGAAPYPGDVEKLLEAAVESGADDFSIGISTLSDMTWKQRLDVDACTQCGRCQEVCPAYNSGKVLSPKWLILDTRAHELALHTKMEALPARRVGLLRALDRIDAYLVKKLTLDFSPSIFPTLFRAANQLVQTEAPGEIGRRADAQLGGEVMDRDVFWSCTTCRACMEVCPVGIEHLDIILETRRSLTLMRGDLPGEAQSALRLMEGTGNPFGRREGRTDWTEGLDVKILQPGDSVEVLYWVGCISAFDKRKQQIARSVATILNRAKIDWAILGDREECTGDPARRLGEENLFQANAKKNAATVSEVNFNTILTHCPHCLHSWKNEYPQIEPKLGSRRVVHHTQFIQELISAGKVTLPDSADQHITFHDPCYLGRYNDEYDAPREVLVQLGGRPSKEMRDNRQRSLCCGAGGGHFFMDLKVGERINVQRINQAAETGAKVVATGCPFCLHMLEDGVKLTDREEQLRVKDIAELVVESMI